MKTTHWEIHTRNLHSPAKINHLWWKVYSVNSLEEAKESCSFDRIYRGWEYKIVRVETTRTEIDEEY